MFPSVSYASAIKPYCPIENFSLKTLPPASGMRALSDLRNVAIAEEAYFMESEQYLACKDGACAALPGVVSLPKGTTLERTLGEDAFVGEARNESGSGKVFRWDSDL